MSTNPHLRRTPPKGQAYCEKCSKPVLEWTIQTILVSGHFYDVCRTCYSNLMESKDETPPSSSPGPNNL